MEFKNFADTIASEVRKEMGGGYRVSLQDVNKNNGITLTGLWISDGKSNVSPVIYLEPFHRAFSGGRITLWEAVSEVINTYEENRNTGRCYNASGLAEYGNVKKRLKPRLVNTEKNREFLATVPSRNFLDLSLIYEVGLDCGDGSHGGIIVNRRQMERWGVMERRLFEQANANMDEEDSLEIRGLSEILREAIGDEAAGECVMEDDTQPMYVMGNRNRWYGAAAMANHKAMRKAAEIFGRDFMILPSSVHELILVPSSGESDEAERLVQMVEDVNKTVLAEEEILSRHVYRYDFQSGNISVAA